MSAPLDTARTYRLSDRLLLKEVGEELVAFDSGSLAVHELNTSMAAVAQMCDGKHSCEQMVIALAARHGLELKDASRAVYRALRILRDQNLLEGG